jgi:hypothetical protein
MPGSLLLQTFSMAKPGFAYADNEFTVTFCPFPETFHKVALIYFSKAQAQRFDLLKRMRKDLSGRFRYNLKAQNAPFPGTLFTIATSVSFSNCCPLPAANLLRKRL